MCSVLIMRYILWLLVLFPVAASQAADICAPAKLVGSYAFQLAGSTSISGTPQPTVSLGRITLDGSGGVSGTSSVKFSGLLLGNPVTGTYQANADCTVTWKLQDDSGAYQNFSGKYTPDAIRVQFRQIDPGGVPGGIMVKTPDSCTSADLKKEYSFIVSGSTTPMNPGQSASSISGKGVVDTARDGNFQVDNDCAVHFILTLPVAEGQSDSPPLTMRGFLVNEGKEILAFQTDPGAMVSARLTALSR